MGNKRNKIAFDGKGRPKIKYLLQRYNVIPFYNRDRKKIQEDITYLRYLYLTNPSDCENIKKNKSRSWNIKFTNSLWPSCAAGL